MAATLPAGAALAEVGSIGPYFTLDPAPGPDWLPLSALTDGGPRLAERVAATRAALGTGVEPRVAVSVTQLGLAARLLSPLLAVAVGHRLVIGVDPAAAWWRPVPASPYPLAFPAASIRSATPASTVDEAAALLAAEVLEPLVAPLVTAAGRLTPVAAGLLWGNVASAVAGAATVIGAARPERAAAARAVTAALLARPPLTGTGTVSAAGRFRRRSCCLIYRAGAGLCGDCALAG